MDTTQPTPTKKEQAIELRKQGLSYAKIGEKLGFTKQYAIKLIKSSTGNGGVTKEVTKGNHLKGEGVTEGGNQEVTKDTSVSNGEEKNKAVEQESVADLKIKLNTILKDIYSKIQNLRVNQKDISKDIEEELTEQFNKRIDYILKNRLEAMREEIIKKLRESTEKR